MNGAWLSLGIVFAVFALVALVYALGYSVGHSDGVNETKQDMRR